MNQAELKARIIALEQQAATQAERIERLETAILDFRSRTGALEASLIAAVNASAACSLLSAILTRKTGGE